MLHYQENDVVMRPRHTQLDCIPSNTLHFSISPSFLHSIPAFIPSMFPSWFSLLSFSFGICMVLFWPVRSLEVS